MHECLAGLFEANGRMADARTSLEQAITVVKEQLEVDAKAGPLRGFLGFQYMRLADLLRRMGESAAAAEALQQAEALRPRR